MIYGTENSSKLKKNMNYSLFPHHQVALKFMVLTIRFHMWICIVAYKNSDH